MPDNHAEVSAMREKLKHETDTANTLRSFANEIRIIHEQHGDDPVLAFQKTSETLSHYKI